MGSGNGSDYWASDTGRIRFEELLREQTRAVLAEQRPRTSPGTHIAAVVGLIAILGAIASVAVAMERTREVPTLRADVAKVQTASEVNAAEHRAIIERQTEQGSMLRAIDSKLDRALRR